MTPAGARIGPGLALATLGAIAFSGKAILAKLMYLHGVDAVQVLFWRMLLALPLFLALAWWAGRGKSAFTARDWRAIVGLGFCGYYLASMLDHGQQPQAACDAPRWRVNQGLEINVERHMPVATRAALAALGHQIVGLEDSYMDFGSGQFIWRLGDAAVEGYVAASDPRRDGAAVGF